MKFKFSARAYVNGSLSGLLSVAMELLLLIRRLHGRRLVLARLLHPWLILRNTPVLATAISTGLSRWLHRDVRHTSHSLDEFILLHITYHFEVVNVLLGSVEPVIQLIVESEPLVSHLAEHFNFHLSLAHLHEELVSGGVSHS